MSEVKAGSANEQSVEVARAFVAGGESAALRFALAHISELQAVAKHTKKHSLKALDKAYFEGKHDAYERAAEILKEHLHSLIADVPLL